MITVSDNWTCLHCGELSERQFRSCWNCGAARTGELDPTFRVDTPPEEQRPTTRHSILVSLAWLVGWLIFCAIVILSAVLAENLLPLVWAKRVAFTLALILICLFLAVFINVLSKLYLWLMVYLDDEPDLDKFI